MSKQNKKAAAETFDALNQSQAFFEKYKKAVIIAFVAVVVLILGFAAYKAYIEKPREEKASTALGKAQELFGQEQYQKALDGDKTMMGFTQIASEYSGTDAANLAKLYAGLCYYQLGKYQQAVDNLEDFSTCGDALVSPAATQALGNAYVEVGQLDKAVETLKKAAKAADGKAANGRNNSLSPVFLLQAGEILESQKKTDEALEVYNDIKKNYVSSPLVQSSDIDKYILRVSK